NAFWSDRNQHDGRHEDSRHICGKCRIPILIIPSIRAIYIHIYYIVPSECRYHQNVAPNDISYNSSNNALPHVAGFCVVHCHLRSYSRSKRPTVASLGVLHLQCSRTDYSCCSQSSNSIHDRLVSPDEGKQLIHNLVWHDGPFGSAECGFNDSDERPRSQRHGV